MMRKLVCAGSYAIFVLGAGCAEPGEIGAPEESGPEGAQRAPLVSANGVCDPRDSGGRRLHSSGSWNSDTSLTVSGGQIMNFVVNNINTVGTTITITSDTGESQGSIILPMLSVEFSFSIFGREPMTRRFDISTHSDAFIVRYCLYSTWIPGDPPNG